jgi:hypothetical protein
MDQLERDVLNQRSVGDDQVAVQSVSVCTRHKRSCPKRDRPEWARCNCAKWLYIYRNGKSKQISAKTRNWARAEQKAREIRDSFDPIKLLQQRLETKTYGTTEVEIGVAVEQFTAEVARLQTRWWTEDQYARAIEGKISMAEVESKIERVARVFDAFWGENVGLHPVHCWLPLFLCRLASWFLGEAEVS